jgi:hypothetical protein
VAKEEHAHVALPKLYGAPAYARPPVLTVVTTERPFNPDDLPLESQLTDEERELLAQGDPDETWTAATATDDEAPSREGSPRLRGRPFHLSAITRKVRRDSAPNGR